MRSSLVKLLLFCLAFYATERFCHRKTEGFQLYKIRSENRYDPRWEGDLPARYPEGAFDQPYYFLGSGGQCYAFVSGDRRYVLKFFKQHHMRAMPWLEAVRLPAPLDSLRRRILADREKRSCERIFGSYLIAYNKLKEQTGLIALHLNKTDQLGKRLTIIDKIGVAHQIDLDTTEFALQYYARPFYAHLKALLRKKRFADAKESLASFAHLIKTRARKGIIDYDPVIKKNFGFIGNSAVEIDLGSFAWAEQVGDPKKLEQTLLIETLRLKKWLAKRAPELLDYLEAELQNHLGPH